MWVPGQRAFAATMAGQAFSLDDTTWSIMERNSNHAVYRHAGFLHSADLTATSPIVSFRIDFGHRDDLITHQKMLLEPAANKSALSRRSGSYSRRRLGIALRKVMGEPSRVAGGEKAKQPRRRSTRQVVRRDAGNVLVDLLGQSVH